MAKAKKNPLEFLNLSGLSELTEKINRPDLRGLKEAAHISAVMEPSTGDTPQPEHPTLGPLSCLKGTWVGPGFNIIELPNRNQDPHKTQPAEKFRVMLNATSETLTFTEIHGNIINRGNAQGDIQYLGLHYLQQILDVNLPKDNNGIHLETGLFLNVVVSENPQENESVARLGSIPHGDALLAQGRFTEVNGGPFIEDIKTTPFTVDAAGNVVPDDSEAYLALLTNAIPPPGVPKEAILNPNIILKDAIKGQDIIKTTVIFLDANPINGISNVPATTAVGGINNIPFIKVNANATTMTAIFWVEQVRNPDGTNFLQLQYTQTVVLDFPVFGAPPGNAVTNIKWPHISVATLRLQP